MCIKRGGHEPLCEELTTASFRTHAGSVVTAAGGASIPHLMLARDAAAEPDDPGSSAP